MHKIFGMIIFLVILIGFSDYALPTFIEKDEIIYQNSFYKVRISPTEDIQFLAHDGKPIISAVSYTGEYGEVYNSVKAELLKGSSQIQLDQVQTLRQGDVMEIRAESYMGRMNKPKIHKAKIERIDGTVVHFTPAIGEKFDFGVFVKITEQSRVLQNISFDEEELHDGKLLIVHGETSKSVVELKYHFFDDSSRVNVRTNVRYREDTKVFNEALNIKFEPPVHEVYRKNGKVDRTKFQKEYWLGTQGVQFGEGKSSALIYHTPEVSSLQLKTDERELIINLDDMHDHRFLQGIDVKNKGKVRHASEYHEGQERKNSFSITLGHEPDLMPRVMLHPHGFLATHIWTEHADNATLESNKAVYFGTDQAASFQQATGGFAKYRIPVTKSVFYTNPYYPFHHHMGVSIKEEPRYMVFLQDLYAHGHEIAMHNVYPYDYEYPTRAGLEEALKFMTKMFGTVTWIDHGHLPSNLSFQGLDEESPYYAKDLWEKYGIQYFWHYSSEDGTSIYDDFNLLQTKNGDAKRTPLYWQHATETGEFYTFSSAIVTPLEVRYYTEENLEHLIDEWGVFISHVYPPRTNKRGSSPYYVQDGKGNLVIHPNFDHSLKIMDDLRDQGKLYLTTIHDIMNYWRLLEHIRFEYLLDGSVRVHGLLRQFFFYSGIL